MPLELQEVREEGLASGDGRQGLATVEESHKLVSREGRKGLLLDASRCTVYSSHYCVFRKSP